MPIETLTLARAGRASARLARPRNALRPNIRSKVLGFIIVHPPSLLLRTTVGSTFLFHGVQISFGVYRQLMKGMYVCVHPSLSHIYSGMKEENVAIAPIQRVLGWRSLWRGFEALWAIITALVVLAERAVVYP